MDGSIQGAVLRYCCGTALAAGFVGMDVHFTIAGNSIGISALGGLVSLISS